jgi:hypothetical protein
MSFPLVGNLFDIGMILASASRRGDWTSQNDNIKIIMQGFLLIEQSNPFPIEASDNVLKILPCP